MKLTHRQWFYHPDEEARIFEIGEVPGRGWVDTPDKFPGNLKAEKIDIRKLGKEEVYRLAEKHGVTVETGEHWLTTRSRVAKELG